MTLQTTRQVGYGFGVGVGLLAMGFAASTYVWYGYMNAHPAIGSVSTTPGFTVFYASIFVLGTILTYVSFTHGLAAALADD